MTLYDCASAQAPTETSPFHHERCVPQRLHNDSTNAIEELSKDVEKRSLDPITQKKGRPLRCPAACDVVHVEEHGPQMTAPSSCGGLWGSG